VFALLFIASHSIYSFTCSYALILFLRSLVTHLESIIDPLLFCRRLKDDTRILRDQLVKAGIEPQVRDDADEE